MSREYIVAGKCVSAVRMGKQSFKGYCSKIRMGRIDFALASETIKFGDIIDLMLKRSNINLNNLDVNPGIFQVMIYELYFGKNKKIKGGGAVKKELKKHMDILNENLEILMKEKGVNDRANLISERAAEVSKMPTYIRVNLLKITCETGLAIIKQSCQAAKLDEHVPNLIVIPPNLPSFGTHPHVLDGSLIIQDKASTIPSYIISEEWRHMHISMNSSSSNDNDSDGCIDVIDACAAPGNKTSHVAASLSASLSHVKNSSESSSESSSGSSSSSMNPKITAFDRSKDRYELLQRRMELAGADQIVQVRNDDFLKCNHNAEEFDKVGSVMVDPSCSGSGLIRSLDRSTDTHNANPNDSSDNEGYETNNRLEQLHQMQVKMVLKAMSFPSARHVVYSTCSIHMIENEDVVAEVLHSKGDTWELQAPGCMKTWKRRGIASIEELKDCSFAYASATKNKNNKNNKNNKKENRNGDEDEGNNGIIALNYQQRLALIRMLPCDGANGFFVASFVRKKKNNKKKNIKNKKNKDENTDEDVDCNKRYGNNSNIFLALSNNKDDVNDESHSDSDYDLDNNNTTTTTTITTNTDTNANASRSKRKRSNNNNNSNSKKKNGIPLIDSNLKKKKKKKKKKK